MLLLLYTVAILYIYVFVCCILTQTKVIVTFKVAEGKITIKNHYKKQLL